MSPLVAASREFARMSQQRRAMDTRPRDDVARVRLDDEWISLAQQIIGIRASTGPELRAKARAALLLLDTGAADVGTAMARSLCEDLA